MFAFAVIHPQAFAAPQRAVFPHPDAIKGQGDHIAAVERPAVFRQASRRVGMVMQYRLDR